ncbi:MAG: Crp/Fnr family transcriptional regulator [Elusimicrobiaceae bacterium]|nr:Crp/Fnr family transcriptional regulator [Elusimicrobiaceae bacterium]
MSFTKREVPDCDKCISRSNCIYEHFDRAAQRTWKSLRSSCAFADGEYLFNEGEPPPGLFIVCTGRVKIYKTSASGQQLISRIEHTGDLVGHIAFFAGGNFQSSGEVMGDTVISLVDNALFLDFLRKHPDASVAVMRALARDVREGDTRAHDIAYKPAKTRMADVILKTSLPESGRNFVVKGVKRRELAEMAGLTVETAVRILAEFEKNKIIKRNGKEIVITNKSSLDKIAAAEI